MKIVVEVSGGVAEVTAPEWIEVEVVDYDSGDPEVYQEVLEDIARAKLEDLFAPLPADRVLSGTVEMGAYLDDSYEFETQTLALGVAPDGSVWAKIANSIEKIPCQTN